MNYISLDPALYASRFMLLRGRGESFSNLGTLANKN